MHKFFLFVATLFLATIALAQPVPLPVVGGPAPVATKKEKLPIYEYNEGYPIYQDYYHKRRLSIFRDEFNSLKKKITTLETKVTRLQQGKTAAGSSTKLKQAASTIALLEERVKALTDDNRRMSEMLEIMARRVRINSIATEGEQCFPVHIHR